MSDSALRRRSDPVRNSRLAWLMAGTLAGFIALGARLFQLQLLEHAYYLNRARRDTLVFQSVTAPRGRMFDEFGRLLVSTRPAYELYVRPAELRHPSQAVRNLAGRLGDKPGTLWKRVRRGLSQAPLEEVVLKRSLSQAELARVIPLVDSTGGVYLGVRPERRYPYGELASHVFGYMGAITPEELKSLRHEGYSARDMVGKAGLDREYDRELRGKKGLDRVLVDAMGRTISSHQARPPTPGLDLHLTLDLALQQTAERALARTLARLRVANGEPSAGAAVVLQVSTGRVLAMASMPNFDPRPFARGITAQEYHRLLADPTLPLLSRATETAFPPGSTFKLVNGMAALQEGLATANRVFYCGGVYKGFHCFLRSGHGHITFVNAIAQSCDVTFYKLGDRLGIRRLDRYARACGLGQRTGIDLPVEDPGLMPSPAWKEKVWGQPWYDGDTINTSIGQGFVLATPLQMANVAAAVANGGKLYRPYLVDRATTWRGVTVWEHHRHLIRRLPVKPGLLAVIRRGMRGAVLGGTCTAANSPMVAVAGKTGTAEALPTPSNPHGLNHTWFVCFAPYRKPEIAAAVFFEKSGGYGGSVAAPVARKIIERYFSSKKRMKP